MSAFGRLDDLEGFDADLFGYPAAAAALLDPQHRLFLEVAWHALEDAAIDPDRDPAQIGVFAGCAPSRYLHHHLLGNPALAPAAGTLAEDWDDALTGSGCDYLPTRTAFALGLSGPAVAVQTACSTSLVAVCQAGQSLLDYRCDVAIAGGAAVVSTRQAGYRLRPGGLLATDGVCRPYDAAATGQVFGNGAGAVVLKRLADARADGDHVYAVLAGWAVNNDGADRPGFTVPGVSGQAAVMAEALASVGWDAADVGYLEGHGTGTPVGDAIEVDALARVRRGARAPLLLGSVKGNLGNLDAAAGVISLIKAVYAVRTGQVPGTAHFTAAHDDVDLAAAGAEVDAQTRPWAGERRAGVSSFGLGGTNAHVLVEPAPATDAPDAGAPGPVVLGLSAGSPAALRELARRLALRLADGDLAVADVAHTLAVGRRRLAYRDAVACADAGEAVRRLTALAAGDPASDDDAAVRAWRAGDEPVRPAGPAGAAARLPVPADPALDRGTTMTVRDDQRDQQVGPELPYPQGVPARPGRGARPAASRRPGRGAGRPDAQLRRPGRPGRRAGRVAARPRHRRGRPRRRLRGPSPGPGGRAARRAGGRRRVRPARPGAAARTVARTGRRGPAARRRGYARRRGVHRTHRAGRPHRHRARQPTPATPATTAYAMFTSGSTGQPKGAVIEHRALTEKVTSIAEFSGFDTATRCLAFASIGFDVSVVDMLAPAAGGTVVLAGDAERADPTRLYRICAEQAVDVVVLPPPILPLLDPVRLPGVRLVVTGGEATGPEQVGRWTAGGRRFVSVYGPTEATVLVTWFEGSGEWTRPIPIGRPAANHRIHLCRRRAARGRPGGDRRGARRWARARPRIPLRRRPHGGTVSRTRSPESPGSGSTAPVTWPGGCRTGAWSSSAGPTGR